MEINIVRLKKDGDKQRVLSHDELLSSQDMYSEFLIMTEDEIVEYFSGAGFKEPVVGAALEDYLDFLVLVRLFVIKRKGRRVYGNGTHQLRKYT
jgi:hypothetical protein